MKEISVGKGMVALVDDEDFERINNHKWHAQRDRNTYYAVRVIRINGRRRPIKMHKEVLGIALGSGPKVDHRNRNGLDNQKANLRAATSSENGSNSKRSLRNTSGFRGVCWNKRSKKWQAAIRVNKSDIYIGVFSRKEAAAKAYDEFARRYHGEFATTNF